MKKIIIPIIIMILIPLITVEKINNKNYYLETEINTYTKEEIDSKIKELKDKIDSNTISITETKNILTEIKSKLNDYALKTSLNKTNEDIENLLTLANQNKTRIDELENNFGSLRKEVYWTGSEAIIDGNPLIKEIPLDGVAMIRFVQGNDYKFLTTCFVEQVDDPDNIISIGGHAKTEYFGYMPTVGLSGTKQFKFTYSYSTTTPILKEIDLYYYE